MKSGKDRLVRSMRNHIRCSCGDKYTRLPTFFVLGYYKEELLSHTGANFQAGIYDPKLINFLSNLVPKTIVENRTDRALLPYELSATDILALLRGGDGSAKYMESERKAIRVLKSDISEWINHFLECKNVKRSWRLSEEVSFMGVLYGVSS